MTESDYFEFSFSILQNKPKFSVRLKLEFLNKDRPFFISKSGRKIPLTSSSEQYFKHYISDENLAIKLHTFRKKFFNIQYCISYWKNNFILKGDDCEFCDKYIESMKKREVENFAAAIAKDSYKINLRNAKLNSSERSSIAAKKRFENPEFKNKMMSLLHSDEAKKKRIESFRNTMGKKDVKAKFLAAVNNKDRIEKISKSSRERWKNLSYDDKSVALQNLRPKRKFRLNNFNMNLNEFIVAGIISELCEDWSYERQIRYQDISYYPDFVIESKKLIIECYGMFWHADPRYFDQNDIVMSFVTAKDIWDKNQKRIDNLKLLGYNVIIIWEDEISGSRDDLRESIRKAISQYGE